MASTSPLALFGGTFDPVHQAHIEGALAVSEAFGGCPVRLLPNAVPPHRPQPAAGPEDRLAMLELACESWPQLTVDDLELRREQPSYTIDTLQHYRDANPQRPLVFVMGADSLATLDRWHRWREFAALCHLAVLPRPGADAPPEAVVKTFPEADPDRLLATPAGLRLMLESPWLDLSATGIRATLGSMNDNGLDSRVRDYIREHQLYGNRN